jgi:hypothetical protein
MRAKFIPSIIREISVHFQMNRCEENATTTTLKNLVGLSIEKEKNHYP